MRCCARQRRALPPGGEVIGDYRFQGEDGPTDFAELFDHDERYALAMSAALPCRAPMQIGAHEGMGARTGGRTCNVAVDGERLLATDVDFGLKMCRRGRHTSPKSLHRVVVQLQIIFKLKAIDH